MPPKKKAVKKKIIHTKHAPMKHVHHNIKSATAPLEGHAINHRLELIPESKLSKYGKIDYHMHTTIGDGVDSVENIVDYVEKNLDLDIIAITDHDQLKGSLHAQEYAKKKKY